MSSIPGYMLEDYIEELYIHPTKEETARRVKFHEPIRENIENWLMDFDEDSQSWRDYRNSGAELWEQVLEDHYIHLRVKSQEMPTDIKSANSIIFEQEAEIKELSDALAKFENVTTEIKEAIENLGRINVESILDRAKRSTESKAHIIRPKPDETEENGLYIDKLLETLDWEKIWGSITSAINYERFEDDTIDGYLSVCVGSDGDAWIKTHSKEFASALRFRECGGGGGQSSRTRKGLLVLMMAIDADNKETPQNRG